MRDINPDVWVNYLMKQIVNVDDCIIDDIRYQNEVDACIKNGFNFIKVNVLINIMQGVRTNPRVTKPETKQVLHILF